MHHWNWTDSSEQPNRLSSKMNGFVLDTRKLLPDVRPTRVSSAHWAQLAAWKSKRMLVVHVLGIRSVTAHVHIISPSAQIWVVHNDDASSNRAVSVIHFARCTRRFLMKKKHPKCIFRLMIFIICHLSNSEIKKRKHVLSKRALTLFYCHLNFCRIKSTKSMRFLCASVGISVIKAV